MLFIGILYHVLILKELLSSIFIIYFRFLENGYKLHIGIFSFFSAVLCIRHFVYPHFTVILHAYINIGYSAVNTEQITPDLETKYSTFENFLTMIRYSHCEGIKNVHLKMLCYPRY